ncbi:relaxase/mobilization nuclease domain-containing protein [Aquabacterium sp. J223]|uniref:relaxase/mobilization nuclease domain-containing protein n=1 Tax=Aquabacterium sp. J223 TaxID=2898431 RepID=UPI0021AD8B14|nr:relaxase/mobilization nuclease domain-containing protein [Aquabacterium sp. J223]UUX95393.1 relaxase/mobilization nuclease domain-containing protein [Aquabacterium sp. J223]
MAQPTNIDGTLITWGDRLFYPGNRVVKVKAQPRFSGNAARLRAAAIRKRIEATVVRRAPQVMVKVTGGGRGMKAIAAHFRYISKNGRLEVEDQRGETMRGKDSLRDLADEWRLGGSLIADDAEPGHRREAFNIMLSMPRGTDPESMHWAAREFAKSELADHKYVMVLHDHQANPHVHLSVRAESVRGGRLNPRKTDLHRWRETFAAKLRERGIEAEATRQATRGVALRHPELWQVKAHHNGRLLKPPAPGKPSAAAQASRVAAQQAWCELAKALAASESEADKRLARSVEAFATAMIRQPSISPAPGRDPQLSPSTGERER